MTPSAFFFFFFCFFFFWWSLCCFPQQMTPWIIYLFIFSRALCFDWCKRSRRRRVTEGIGRDSPTEGVKAGEVMREMEFAGSVWDRSALWSCKCVFCLHACACDDCIPATLGWLCSWKRLKLRVTLIPGSFAEFCLRDLEFVLTPGSSNGTLTP